MKSVDEKTAVSNALTDRAAIGALAAEIAEATSAFGELAVLERRVEDGLREHVARILNRYEQCPEEIRDIEERLMEIKAPLLPVALLQQYFLVRSKTTEQSLVAQLARLTQAPDRKASQLALDALREAANSEISRLRNLGYRALFASQRLDEVDLLGYAEDAHSALPLRIEAVTTLVSGRHTRGAEALLSVLEGWCELPDDRRPMYNDRLQQLARSFKSYAAEGNKASQVVKSLFEGLENGGLAQFDRKAANAARRKVQTALAALEEATLAYVGDISADSLTYDHVFTLRQIARKSPAATYVLYNWAKAVIARSHMQRSRYSLAKEIAISLRQASWGDLVVAACISELKALLDSSMMDNLQEILAQLDQIGTPSRPLRLIDVLAEMAEDYESWGQLDKGQALQLRFAFEKGNRHITPSQMTPSMRAVLMLALEQTSEAMPWRDSARWFVQHYPQFQGQDKVSILEAIGHVARMERHEDNETDAFRYLCTFLDDVAQKGTSHEASIANHLLGQLPMAARPQHVRPLI